MTHPILFVTGMQRSGTTLLAKLLDRHPGLSILSQPFPYLFYYAKRAFLRTLGDGEARYPLGTVFLEDRYSAADFSAFLREIRIDAATVGRLFEEMRSFSGQYTRADPTILADALERLDPGDLHHVAGQLYRSLSARPDARWFGGKETTCEEFLPYLLGRGGSAVVILRDPRDVLASLNHGLGPRFAGLPKPTLFNARAWRKSVAFALHLEGHPGFLWLRYEDLVTRPLDCLDRIAATLGVDPFTDAMLTGGAWPGNSSHLPPRQGFTAESVNGFRGLLSPDVVAYLEATCHPELRYLGYPISVQWSDVPQLLREFRDPYDGARDGLPGYGADSAYAEEIRRVELLAARPGPGTRPYFLFEDVHERLRRLGAR
jgi:hypothetical protein